MEVIGRRSTDLWFTECQTPRMNLDLRITDVLLNKDTEYQHIMVAESEEYGKIMVLDGAIQITERDEFCYHEMMAHVAMSSHPDPRRVLIVGGGDGGILREIVKYDHLEKATLVDIDKEVVMTSRQFFPEISSGMDHPKSEVLNMDAMKYIKEHEDTFDIIIIDSTDPVDFAAGLFQSSFYSDVFRSLHAKGLVVAQTESPFAEPVLMKQAYSEMKKSFKEVFLFWGAMPTYPTGMWTYTIGCKETDPRTPVRPAPAGLKYYSPQIHRHCFTLPPFLQTILYGENKDLD